MNKTYLHDLLVTLYNITPAQMINYLHRMLSKTEKIEPVDGVSLILDAKYFARRDPLIQRLIERVRLGSEINEVLTGFNARMFDDRVVEYPYVVKWLMEQPGGMNLLDIGCVMNNKLISNTLRERCHIIWLCNPVMESEIYVLNPVYYYQSDLRKSFPDNSQFPLITCLSTIEHIGYDNSQYGSEIALLYKEPSDAPLLESVQKISKLLAPGGNLFISVPFGHRETITHPKTQKKAMQVFNADSLNRAISMLKSNGVVGEYIVYEMHDNGWREVDPYSCQCRYAHGCPASCAVAFITATRKR